MCAGRVQGEETLLEPPSRGEVDLAGGFCASVPASNDIRLDGGGRGDVARSTLFRYDCSELPETMRGVETDPDDCLDSIPGPGEACILDDVDALKGSNGRFSTVWTIL